MMLNFAISILLTVIFILLALCCYKTVTAGPYVKVGLAVPLSPETGYTPDSYGIAAAGYIHRIDKMMSFDLGLVHRSLTGEDHCNNDKCNGDNAIEASIILEWK